MQTMHAKEQSGTVQIIGDSEFFPAISAKWAFSCVVASVFVCEYVCVRVKSARLLSSGRILCGRRAGTGRPLDFNGRQ